MGGGSFLFPLVLSVVGVSVLGGLVFPVEPPSLLVVYAGLGAAVFGHVLVGCDASADVAVGAELG